MIEKLASWGILAVAGFAVAAAPAAVAGSCVKKGAIGEAGSQQDAKLQVDEALLQAVDWGAWAAWMSSGNKVGAAAKLPGYTFGARSYSCKQGGSFGWTCRGSATICKT
ncbi:MAG: hypothetical protein ACT4N2_09365 [Hyphomicrobium sp.]